MTLALAILAAKRTPVGKARGQFRHVPPEWLAAAAIRGALAQAGLEPGAVDEVVLGNAVGAGNLARLAALEAGLPLRVPGVTVDRQCAGGLEAVRLAMALIRGGLCGLCVAGGVESASQEPLRLAPDGRPLQRARFSPEHVGDPDMGPAAEELAARYGVDREAQDLWAHRSHARLREAADRGLLAEEIAPVEAPAGGARARPIARDELPRRPPDLALLRRLKPAFRTDGTVTAGNASRRHDGAAVLVLAGSPHGRGARPLGRLRDVVVTAGDPNLPGEAMILAVRELLRRWSLRAEQVDLYELNEPFAAVVLACIRALDLDPERVNVWGGALALGHPYAASGAILLVRLLYGLHRRGGRLGVAALPSAGGIGAAALVEREGG